MRIAQGFVFVLMCGYITQALGVREYLCKPVSRPKITINKNYWFEKSSGQGMLCGEDRVPDACKNGDIVWRGESNRPFVKCDTTRPASTWVAITPDKIPSCSDDKSKYDEFVQLGDEVFFYKYAVKKSQNPYKIADNSYCKISKDKWCVNGHWNPNGQCVCGPDKQLNKRTGTCVVPIILNGTCNAVNSVPGGTAANNVIGVDRGSKALCNVADPNTCNIGDNIFASAPFTCTNKGWETTETQNIQKGPCTESSVYMVKTVGKNKYMFDKSNDTLRLSFLALCSDDVATLNAEASQSKVQQTSTEIQENKCKIGNDEYTVGTDKKQNTNYVVCKVDADCNKATLPNAKQLRCSGAKDETCGLCIAEQCNDNFTVKHVDGRNFGFCIIKAEQGCIDAVGDKHWDNKTKSCDCGDKVWDDATNTCKEKGKSDELEIPAQPETIVCEESKGLKQSESNPQECVCIEDGAEYNKEKDRCEKPETEIVIDETDDKTDEMDESEYIDEEEQRRQAEEEARRKAEEEERKKLEEARKETEQEYKSARDNEQSDANKALTAAAVAAGGLGGMEWASGRAEQSADADAEREMSAYIATMKCEYGDGGQVDLGKEETLPGGNEMLSYKTEFKQLAEKLKATKTALNLRPGIESEIVYDRAETGLYDYQTAETGGGANPSLSRALMNPDGTDATAWNAQKQESADKVQAGKTKTGIGVIGGAVSNAAINTDVIKNVVEKIRK